MHAVGLFSGHRLLHHLHLHAFLAKSTGTAPTHDAYIHQQFSFDISLLPDFVPDVDLGAAAETNKAGQPKQGTVLAHRLGVLAQSVARHEVGHDAEAEVVEAAEKTVFPLPSHPARWPVCF